MATDLELVYLSKREVLRRTGLGYDTILRMMNDGNFPMSVTPYGTKRIFWLKHEVEAWMLSQPRGRSYFRGTVRRVLLDD